jgi:YggT family protein
MADLLIRLIDAAFSLYSLIIIARAFLPLIGADPANPVIRFIFDITEPILAPLRRFTIVGMWDFSPLAALVILWIIQQLLHSLLFSVLG